MTPDNVHIFRNNNVGIEVHEVAGQNVLYIQAGIASVRLLDEDLDDLIELLTAYREEFGDLDEA
jgi:hypothetical protein